MKRCLIVDEMHPGLEELLGEAGWEAIYKPGITREEIRKELGSVSGLIVRSKVVVDRELIHHNTHLKFIARAGAGLDNIDLEAAQEAGITVLHAAEGNKDAVGEFTIGLLLSLLRNIPRADREVRDRIWHREENRGTELSGLTVGVIGYGNMGKAFVSRLKAFQCKILVYDKYLTGFGSEDVKECTLEKLQKQADVISLHIPLTNETRGMVSVEFLKKNRNPVFLLNTSRGEIVPLKTCVEGLKQGWLRGVGLDVLENEKLATFTPSQAEAFDFLKNNSRVIFTPHIAGWTFESHVKINVALVAKIKALG